MPDARDVRWAQLLDDLETYEGMLTKERLRAQVREQLQTEREEAAFVPPPGRMSLADDLAADIPRPGYTIEGLHNAGGNTLLAAAFKAGKTTALLNVTKCLAEGGRLFGLHEITEPRRVGYWNYEVGEAMFIDWIRPLDIRRPENVSTLSVRGYHVPLWTPAGKKWAIRWLADRAIDFWIVDPFGPAFSGAGNENDNTEVRAFLSALDEIKQGAGVRDLLLATHFGRAEQREGHERARGATVLDDWADARWILTVDEDTDDRFLRATGRDVDVPSIHLTMNETTKILTGTHENRRAGKINAVLQAVKDEPGMNKSTLRSRLRMSTSSATVLIEDLSVSGDLRVEKKGQSQFFYLPTPTQ